MFVRGQSHVFSIWTWKQITRLFSLCQGSAHAVFHSSLICRPAPFRTQTKDVWIHVVRRSLNISEQSLQDIPVRVHTERETIKDMSMRHLWPPKLVKDEKVWLAAQNFDFIHIMDGFSKLTVKPSASVFCISFYCVFCRQWSLDARNLSAVTQDKLGCPTWSGQNSMPTWLLMSWILN